MNRRNFLKSIITVCGAAVVCPGELVKGPVEFRPNPAQKIIGKRINLPWKHYYTTYYYQTTEEHKKLLKVFKKQSEITKFHPPIFVQGIPIFYRSSLYNETTKT